MRNAECAVDPSATKSLQTTHVILHRHVVPRLRKRLVDNIRRADVLKLLDDLVIAGTPIAASRVLSVIRKMFNWSIERGISETSPAYVVKAPSPEVSRDRVLSHDEIVTVLNAATCIGYPAGAFIHVLMLTGRRRAEVSRMKWADIDMRSGVWTLPREATKGGRSHQVPLSPMAMDILSTLPRLESYVFSVNGHSPITGYTAVKRRLEAQLDQDIGDWRQSCLVLRVAHIDG